MKKCLLSLLAFFAVVQLSVAEKGAATPAKNEIFCEEGGFKGHLQGIASDTNSLYWSFYDTILKTDYKGRKIKSVPVVTHAGDLCVAGGKVYVTISIYSAAELKKREGQRCWIFVYDTDLNPVKEVPVPQSKGLDGITFHNGIFYVGGGSRGFEEKPHRTNSVIRLDSELKFLEDRDVEIGVDTAYGVQTINVIGGKLVVSFYARKGTRIFDFETLKPIAEFPKDTSVGIVPVPASIAGSENVCAIADNIWTGGKEHGGGPRKYSAKLLLYRYVDGKLIPYPAW